MIQPLINTKVDRKNVKLSKLVYTLRQELDIYWLININTDSLFNKNQSGSGKRFLLFLRNLAISSITLSICKIYEHQKKGYELNSISGVFRNLIKDSAVAFDKSKLQDFIKKYDGTLENNNLISALERTIRKFRKKY